MRLAFTINLVKQQPEAADELLAFGDLELAHIVMDVGLFSTIPEVKREHAADKTTATPSSALLRRLAVACNPTAPSRPDRPTQGALSHQGSFGGFKWA